MVMRSRLGLLFFLCLLQFGKVWAATVDVQVDRNPVREDESFTVEFSAEQVDDDPDFSPLEKDFRILQRSQSSNFQFINGRMSRQATWILTLMAKRPGALIIPEISFGKDKSRVYKLTVKKAATADGSKASGSIYLDVKVDPEQVYEQAEVIVSVRIYHAVNLMDASISELSVDDKDAIIEKLGADNTFAKRLKGKNYKVFEKRYAVYPQKAGALMIKPFEFETRFVDRRRTLRYKHLTSEPVKILVKPRPSSAKNGPWLPARSVRLIEKWPNGKKALKQGEPVTRTVSIVADGLPATQLPVLGQSELHFAKLYPDQPVLNTKGRTDGVTGTRVEKVAIIPTKSGKYRLPAIEIPWWNTKTNKMEVARIPSRKITVLEAAQPAASVATPPSSTTQNVAPPAEQPAVTTTPMVSGETDLPFYSTKNFWFGVSMLFLYLWVLTILAWWFYSRRAKKRSTKPLATTPVDDTRQAVEKKLKRACAAGEVEAVKDALLQWSRAVWGKSAPTSLGALAKQCGGTIKDEIDYLNKVVYSNKVQHWDGSALYEAIKHFEPEAAKPHRDTQLQPLYYHAS